MLLCAFCIAYRVHRGQKDKGGRAYIRHPLYVALHVKGRACRAAALLHDVLEDSDLTPDDLRRARMSEEVISAAEALTKRVGEEYADYLTRVKENPIAREVKLVDLQHNSDLRRIPSPTTRDFARVDKYAEAIRFLKE